MLRRKNVILGVGGLPYPPSPAFDDVLTPVSNRALVIVIPSHTVEIVLFPFPESLNIWHAGHEVLDTIPVFEAWEMQSGVFFLLQVVIVHLHVFLLDPTLDLFLLFTRCK
jgi:hypothetical protein